METFPSLKNPLAWYAGQLSRRNIARRRGGPQPGPTSRTAMNGIADSTLFAEDGYHPGPMLYARVAERWPITSSARLA